MGRQIRANGEEHAVAERKLPEEASDAERIEA